MIDLAERLLQQHEGFRDRPYRCTAGKLTIGYGRNLDDVGISREEAAYLLRQDIFRAIGDLRLEPYWLDLTEVRQAVLIDMCVNLGWPRLSRFERMRKALTEGDYGRAADEMVGSKWFLQVGARGRTLERMMRTGEV